MASVSVPTRPRPPLAVPDGDKPQGWPEEAAAGVSHPAWYWGSLTRQAVTRAAASPGGTPGAGGTSSQRRVGGRALHPSSMLCSLWGQRGELHITTPGTRAQCHPAGCGGTGGGGEGGCSQAESVGRGRQQRSLPVTPRPQPWSALFPANLRQAPIPDLSARDMTVH